MRWVLVFGFAACYSPTFSAGVPCDPAAPTCPDGQLCVATAGGFTCERDPAATADGSMPSDTPSPDASTLDPLGDEDNDGVLNGVDNCPLQSNPGQHDEDDDNVGDPCDPCPIFATANEPDSDGDGVGDACDPNPDQPGDQIYLFESFENGVPSNGAWDPFGSWTNANDAIAVAVNANHANIGYPMPTGKETLFTALKVTSTGGANNRGGGLIDRKGAAGNDGIACDIYLDGAGTARLGIVHASTATDGGTELIGKDLAWSVNQRVELRESRSGDAFTCATGTTNLSFTTSLSGGQANPESGMWASNASARFEYLLIVTSP